jgi:hypothetical protein
MIRNKYHGAAIQIVGDPSAMNRSSLARSTAFGTLLSHGLQAKPAFTNNINSRIDAVKWALSRNPPLVIDGQACKNLRRGFRGGYCFKLRSGVASLKPDKGEFSHIHDALQYACLWYRKGDRPEHLASQRHVTRIIVPGSAKPRKTGWAV